MAEGAEGEKRSADELTDERRISESVKSVWNERRIRFGDTVPCNSEGDQHAENSHPNAYLPRGILHFSFQQIGKHITVRDGVDGSCHSLSSLVSVSQAAWMRQRKFISDQVAYLRNQKRSFIVARLYDATKHRLRMGELQALLRPCALYPILDGDTWRLVSYDEFRRCMGQCGANLWCLGGFVPAALLPL